MLVRVKNSWRNARTHYFLVLFHDKNIVYWCQIKELLFILELPSPFDLRYWYGSHLNTDKNIIMSRKLWCRLYSFYGMPISNLFFARCFIPSSRTNNSEKGSWKSPSFFSTIHNNIHLQSVIYFLIQNLKILEDGTNSCTQVSYEIRMRRNKKNMVTHRCHLLIRSITQKSGTDFRCQLLDTPIVYMNNFLTLSRGVLDLQGSR